MGESVVPKRRLVVLLSALAVVLGALVAGCGSDSASSSSSSASPSSSDSGKKSIKVGLVTDIGGLNDRSFNQLANQGLEQAKTQLGVTTRVLTSKSNADYVPNLSTLAQQKYDLVIAVGFLMADATETVAKKFPNTKFAIIDFPQAGMKAKPANVQGLLFTEQQSGYIAGYVAGLYVKDNGGDTISAVGGQKIPPVDKYIAGYQAGAKAANPSIKVLVGYSQDFVAQDKCKELALNQIAEGSKVVFQAAGQCGLGALDAAKEKGVQGVGVDADQGYLGDHMLTSAIKKVDVSVFDSAKAVQDGAFKPGTDTVFDVKADGAGIGKLGPEGVKYEAKAKEIQDKIAAGEITGIPETPSK
jgi:basic membrane protein A